ncbi:unnamed protein product, partial [Gulo gulo]
VSCGSLGTWPRPPCGPPGRPFCLGLCAQASRARRSARRELGAELRDAASGQVSALCAPRKSCRDCVRPPVNIQAFGPFTLTSPKTNHRWNKSQDDEGKKHKNGSNSFGQTRTRHFIRKKEEFIHSRLTAKGPELRVESGHKATLHAEEVADFYKASLKNFLKHVYYNRD